MTTVREDENRVLTIGAPLWPMSFGFLGNSLSSIRHGDWMSRGHRKMAADTATKTTAIRTLDPGENKTQKIRQSSAAIYTAVSLNRGPV